MIEAGPSRHKSKAERFAEVDESIREEAIKLAVHYSKSVDPHDAAQVENLIKLATADAKDPDGGVVLAASGKKLSDVGGKNIATLAIRIAERAEDVVRSRIVRAWALNVLNESFPGTVDPRALTEVERILKSANRTAEVEQARFKTGPLSSLSDGQFGSLKEGVILYDPALTEVFDDDKEELKLLQYWNRLHPPLDALNDNPSYDSTSGVALAATLLRGQKYLAGRVLKQFVDSLTDIEHARLAEFLGTNAEVKRKWYEKKVALSPERQALLTRFPAIRHLLTRMEQAQLPTKQPDSKQLDTKQPGKSERQKKRDAEDEVYGRENINPAALKVLESHWSGERKTSVGIYLRVWARQLRGGGWAREAPEEVAIYQEGQRVLAAAVRGVRSTEKTPKKEKSPPPPEEVRQIPKSNPRTMISSGPETVRALPSPEPVSPPSETPDQSESDDGVSDLLAKLRTKTGKSRIDD